VEARIDLDTEFTEMQIKPQPVNDEDVQSFHTFVSSVAGDLSAASFAIQSEATNEQRTNHIVRLQ
jgi:hypothetical protein